MKANLSKVSNFTSLIKAYALGDKLLDSDPKDAVTDTMVLSFAPNDDNAVFLPNSSKRRTLYESTVSQSPARRLLVHRLARTTDPSLIKDKDHHTFLVDLAQEALKREVETTEEAAARCAFHEHAPGAENCYRNKYA